MENPLHGYQKLWTMTQEFVESVHKKDWDEMALIRDRREGRLETIREQRTVFLKPL